MKECNYNGACHLKDKTWFSYVARGVQKSIICTDCPNYTDRSEQPEPVDDPVANKCPLYGNCYWDGGGSRFYTDGSCKSCEVKTGRKQIRVKLDKANEEIAYLKRALDESGTIAKRYRVYWAEEMAEKCDLQDEMFNLEIKVRYAERIKDRWMAQAKKRDRRIGVIKDVILAYKEQHLEWLTWLSAEIKSLRRIGEVIPDGRNNESSTD